MSLQWVHPVFHLLKPEATSPLRPKLPLSPQPLMIEGEQHFQIQETLDSHKHSELQYLMAWKDFPSAQNVWIDHRHVKAP